MRIIIPMAGWGSRLRPHTLTIPKPMIPVAGKAIVHRLVADLMDVSPSKVEEIVFIIREEFGKEIEDRLAQIAAELNTAFKICYQDEPLGTAHAILCAGDSLQGNVIVAFADTLFQTDMKIDLNADGIIWVKQVEDPSAFGVVKMDANGIITDFVEKPTTFVSDLAIIGIYYFNDGNNLRKEMQYLLDHDIREKGEYQLTNALENMKQKGKKFIPGEVKAWFDCGNKNATVDTNQKVLDIIQTKEKLRATNIECVNSVIIEPCYIQKDVKIVNSVVGPHVSIGEGTIIEDSIVKNTIIQNHSKLKNLQLKDSMIGNKASVSGKFYDLSLGDYSNFKA